MQATDFGKFHDPARLGKLDGPDVRRVLVEREMCASPVVVGEVTGQDAAQVTFAENQNVIQTLAADRADEPIWSSARSDAAISPSPVAATCGVRTLCGIPLPRGRGRLETVPTPYGSTRFRDRVPEPRPPRPIGSSRGTPPSRSWSRSDAPACRSRFECRRPYRRRSRSEADTRLPVVVQTSHAGWRETAPSPRRGEACATARRPGG